MSTPMDPKQARELCDLISTLVEGSITDEQFARLDRWLKEDAEARQIYLDYLQLHGDLGEFAYITCEPEPIQPVEKLPQLPVHVPVEESRRLPEWMISLSVALLLPLAVVVGMMLPRGGDPLISPTSPIAANSGVTYQVFFANVAHAKFYGQLPPAIRSQLVPLKDYVLLEGMVELEFPRGASTIIEGPAVFRVESDQRLSLDVGRCSVHAPAGAEGFEIATPEINVVDRGTRFSVNVLEGNITDVQVIEGAADVYRKPTKDTTTTLEPQFERRLNPEDALRFSQSNRANPQPLPFEASQYQRQLPDRIVSYDGTTDAKGQVDELLSISMQRGGKTTTISIEDLILSRVTWYQAQENVGYLIGGKELPELRADFASDRSLRTGLINMGGSPEPLASDPKMTIDVDANDFGTPGMAVMFDRPVRNGPGADIVFFEIQTYSNPIEGDAFHVSPLKFTEGLRSHTITQYDLTMESPEALCVQPTWLYRSDQAPKSLEQLEQLPFDSVEQSTRFDAIAVGIDLSDLGYPEGALVEGLFFQDAMDNEDAVDPVFIAGLPDEPSS
ncbi:FecR domain-containing protein [Bremerella sp. JC817]|uniref:FecR domain-containing protein n=1 Tax=Bremerella sp. JC817 TaxID=3231756 RepID=UPI003457C3C2